MILILWGKAVRPAAITAVQSALPATPCVIGSIELDYFTGVVILKPSSLHAHPRPQQLCRRASWEQL
jgi:hypothetical protein